MPDIDDLLWPGIAVLSAILGVGLMVSMVRWAKRGSKGASMLAAAAFPFPDQPPPKEQVENDNRLKKDSDSGDPANDVRPTFKRDYLD